MEAVAVDVNHGGQREGGMEWAGLLLEWRVGRGVRAVEASREGLALIGRRASRRRLRLPRKEDKLTGLQRRRRSSKLEGGGRSVGLAPRRAAPGLFRPACAGASPTPERRRPSAEPAQTKTRSRPLSPMVERQTGHSRVERMIMSAHPAQRQRWPQLSGAWVASLRRKVRVVIFSEDSLTRRGQRATRTTHPSRQTEHSALRDSFEQAADAFGGEVASFSMPDVAAATSTSVGRSDPAGAAAAHSSLRLCGTSSHSPAASCDGLDGSASSLSRSACRSSRSRSARTRKMTLPTSSDFSRTPLCLTCEALRIALSPPIESRPDSAARASSERAVSSCSSS